MAYEALYRRYRPGRFDDMIGQEHVFATLKNSLVDDRVGHAYLFSGPRGCGKTSSARILAKALNCTNLQEGEPCDECDSCLAFQSGQSYDLYELDAASNNGVDAMRDLIQKVSLGSPGRKKVYILDEVHMLSTGAENALLKTLEEPPPHVTFVLCTTEPNKVVPTVRSRTQHLEFRLYPADELAELAREVAEKAGLTVDEAGIAYAVRAAKGSARDMLSALDQVAAAGGAPDDDDQLNLIMDAIANRDSGAALTAVNEATRLGRDPEVLGRGLLAELRNAFLSSMKADLNYLSDADQQMAHQRSQQFGPAAITRAIEALGTAIIDMRQAPDPRVDLEVVLVRLTRPELDADVSALLARIERLEQGGVALPAAGHAPAPMAAPAPAPAPPASAQAAAAPDVHAAPPAAPAPDVHAAPPAAPAPEMQAPAPAQEYAPAPQEQAAPPPRPAGARPADLARQNLPKKGARRSAPSTAAAPAPVAEAPTQDVPTADQVPAVPQQASAPPTSEKPTLGSLRRAAAGPEVAPPGQPMDLAPPVQAPPPMQQAPPVVQQPPVQAPPVQQFVEAPPMAQPAPPVQEYAEASPQAQPAPAQPAPVRTAPAPVQAAPAPAATPQSGTAPALGAVEAAWNDSLLSALSGRVKSRFSAGHFRMNGAALEFALPNDVHRQRCEDVREEVDNALAQHFGAPIAMTLVVGEPAEIRESLNVAPPTPEELLEDEIMNVHELKDATGDVSASLVERIEQVFPGVEFMEQEARNE